MAYENVTEAIRVLSNGLLFDFEEYKQILKSTGFYQYMENGGVDFSVNPGPYRTKIHMMSTMPSPYYSMANMYSGLNVYTTPGTQYAEHDTYALRIMKSHTVIDLQQSQFYRGFGNYLPVNVIPWYVNTDSSPYQADFRLIANHIGDTTYPILPGDIILCVSQRDLVIDGQFIDYAAVDTDLDTYNSILDIMNKGVHVILASGNGSLTQDFDSEYAQYVPDWYMNAQEGALLVATNQISISDPKKRKLSFRPKFNRLVSAPTGINVGTGSYGGRFTGTSASAPLIACMYAALIEQYNLPPHVMMNLIGRSLTDYRPKYQGKEYYAGKKWDQEILQRAARRMLT